ncbi:MAG: MerR family DNA-binding transcriptional regulator [Halanaerobiaceae bacterium]|jgi:DNA-binding transcriptional MerR regulator|nr:MerR family DNA-binding transcriptional regulator [Halanaerobiaceae bacterium]
MLIGEVSKKYNIGIENLRYYDKIGLLTVEIKK